MDTEYLFYEIVAEDFYKGIVEVVETRFDTSRYLKDDEIPLPIGKNKKVIGVIKYKLSWKIMTEFAALRDKMYAYGKIVKKWEENHSKSAKTCVVAKSHNFDDYKTCLFDSETIHKEQMLFENKKHEVYTVNRHKIALDKYDDKRLVQAEWY